MRSALHLRGQIVPLTEGIGTHGRTRDRHDPALAIDADMPCTQAVAKLVAVRLRREHYTHRSGVSPDEVYPDGPEALVTLRRLGYLLGDVNDVTVRVRITHPRVSKRTWKRPTGQQEMRRWIVSQTERRLAVTARASREVAADM